MCWCEVHIQDQISDKSFYMKMWFTDEELIVYYTLKKLFQYIIK